MPSHPPNVTLRDATPGDAPKVLWLEEVSMKDTATALWGTWRPSATLETLDLQGVEMIERHGQRIGCLSSRWDEDALVVTRLYLGPEHRNHGFGAQILDIVIARAAKRACDVRLSVLVTNPALSFYLRHGFVIVSETSERRQLVKTCAA